MFLLSCRFKYLITSSDPRVPRTAAAPTTAMVGTDAQIKIDPAIKLVVPLSTALAPMTEVDQEI